jgi:CRP/FNR family transcriptional regulator
MADDWTGEVTALARLDRCTRAALGQRARILLLAPGARPFRAGAACEHFLVVLAGVIRVQMVAPSGREIVLYRVEAGESCILTTACLLGRDDYPAEAVVEQQARVAALPAAAFMDLLGSSAALREVVFAAFGGRLVDLMLVLEEVAFRRVDLRLARCLVERRDEQGCVRAAHHELAVELGTAREVISRQLKEFERRGWISMERRRIALRDAAALAAFAAETTSS